MSGRPPPFAMALPSCRASDGDRQRADGHVGRTGERRGPPSLAALVLSLAAALSLASGPAAAQTGIVTGRVEDAQTARPISDASVQIAGTLLGALTDGQGAFRITGVPTGNRTLRVTHLAYGARTVALEVDADEPMSVRVRLSETAIELEPIEITGLTTDERAARGMGFRRGVVTRAQLSELERTNATLSEALRHYVPSVRARQVNLVGSPVCIELRTVRATFRNECLSPAVYLDGVPVTNPTLLYNTLDLEIVESLEVIPAAEAGARYGTGALYGALLIETRRPGGDRITDRTRPSAARSPAFDWDMDPQSHPSTRSFLFAFLGNAAGLAIGLSAAEECIATRQPSNDRIISLCESGKTMATVMAAFTLPALGGALGSRHTFGGENGMRPCARRPRRRWRSRSPESTGAADPRRPPSRRTAPPGRATR
jgi:hypothetical protein